MKRTRKVKFKVREVVQTVFTLNTTRIGSIQETAQNVVLLDCGHIEEVVYWPSRNHYQPGDKCRCYSCPTGRPTMTPEAWKKEFLEELHEAN